MLKALQKFLLLLLLFTGALYLVYQGFLFYSERDKMPPGMTIAGLNVGGLTAEETAVALESYYYAPIQLRYRDELVQLNPQEGGFTLDLAAMVNEAEAYVNQQETWQRYLRYVLGRAMEPIAIDLVASHDRSALESRLNTIATFLDQPPQPPQINDAGLYEMGKPGFVTNVQASLPLVEEALYRTTGREAEMMVEDLSAPGFDISFLANSIQKHLDAFSGVGSVFLLDLQTGEEISINGDIPISGLSILKIAIFTEAYRTLEGPPNEEFERLLYETAVQSSNFGANLLLHEIAGEFNTYKGADILTESMRRLGLVNTFMAVPYDAVAPLPAPTPTSPRPTPNPSCP
jgi:hypothetical protein